MKNHTQFKPYQPNQLFLLPPDMRDWLPDDHLVYFVMDVVDHLNVSAIYQLYDNSKGGQPPFDPKMMVSLLFYAYCIGLPSSRKIEKATYEQVAFRVLTVDQHPDHDTVADFRKRHLKELSVQKEGTKRKGKKPKDPSNKPDSRAQRNFTDAESRIMKDGASKSFEQAYNCQVAVDEESQIIVATNVTQQANDKQQLEPLVEEIKKNTDEQTPEKLSADNGYFSEPNVAYLEGEGIDGYIATGRQKHGDVPQSAGCGRIPKDATRLERMARKLRTKKGRETYSKRKQIVEPVFGQIKEVRGFRRFFLRGLENVSAEWDLICLTHNLLKLFRSGLMPKVA
jgi:transposase